MQRMNSDVCNNLKTFDTTNATTISNTTYKITDSRDGSEYSIRHLADGHCWMVQNLRLINKTLTTLDSDVSDSFTIPASSLATGATNDTWGTTDDADGNNHAVAYYNNDITYGAYYNWYTATAGFGTYETSTEGANVDYSICPRGWKLPKGNQDDYSWYKLYSSYSSNTSSFQTATLTNSDYWAGYVNRGSFSNAGRNGFWWTRTAHSGYYAYILYAENNSIELQRSYYKRIGQSVRCVFVGE